MEINQNNVFHFKFSYAIDYIFYIKKKNFVFYRMLNLNRLYGVVQMVVHYHLMFIKMAMILSSEVHQLNKLEIIFAQ
jgi:hypothetical protein